VSSANLSTPDVIGSLVGFVLTLFVFSYILGDNAFFRVAIHIFIGVAAGYTAVMAIYSVIWPQLIQPVFTGGQMGQILALVVLVLAVLLIFKITPRLSSLGTPVMAFLVGVGAAAAVGGAVSGTLFPQVTASWNLFSVHGLVNGGIVLLGTVATLAYFQFGSRSNRGALSSWLRGISWVGQVFIAITFGALFAGVFAAAMIALVERLGFMVEFAKFIYSLILPVT